MRKDIEKLVERLSKALNRTKGQTIFLLELLEYDLFKFLELEEKLKNNFIMYCPGDLEECEKVLSMSNGSEWFKVNFFTTVNK